jgi:hypothetical protein
MKGTGSAKVICDPVKPPIPSIPNVLPSVEPTHKAKSIYYGPRGLSGALIEIKAESSR